jgi:hypothetical protein
MRPRPLALFALALFALPLLAPSEARADTIVLNAVQQGWYTDDGANNGVPTNPSIPNNYFVGASGGQVHHNYFVFDLTYVTGVTSARIVIPRASSGSVRDDSETYVLYDVLTPAAQLGTASGVSIFNDLGSGTVYASAVVPTPFFSPDPVIIELNAAALAAIQANGGLFAIGGAVTTLRSPAVLLGSEGLFSGSAGNVVQLIVEGQQVPVPEPATLLLLGSGLAGVALRISKKRRAA